MIEKTIRHEGASIAYAVWGESPKTVVLLHGYLENRLIFTEFALGLSQFVRVIAIDLPGHGLSELPAEPLTMNSMACAVRAVLNQEAVDCCFMAGHSMGGYVVFAFLERYPELLSAYCLLHSTPFADTPEKQAMRDREIALVRAGKQKSLFTTNVPNGFAAESLQPLAQRVAFAVEVATKTPPEGIVAALEALKGRRNREELMQNSGKPLLVVLGRHDNYIAFENMKAVALGTPRTTLVVLEHSGHNGFLEEPEALIDAIRAFLVTESYSL